MPPSSRTAYPSPVRRRAHARRSSHQAQPPTSSRPRTVTTPAGTQPTPVTQADQRWRATTRTARVTRLRPTRRAAQRGSQPVRRVGRSRRSRGRFNRLPGSGRETGGRWTLPRARRGSTVDEHGPASTREVPMAATTGSLLDLLRPRSDRDNVDAWRWAVRPPAGPGARPAAPLSTRSTPRRGSRRVPVARCGSATPWSHASTSSPPGARRPRRGRRRRASSAGSWRHRAPRPAPPRPGLRRRRARDRRVGVAGRPRPRLGAARRASTGPARSEGCRSGRSEPP